MPCGRGLPVSSLDVNGYLKWIYSEQMKRILDRLWRCAIYLDARVGKGYTPGISYCRWTSRETATYQRRKGEEHNSWCMPVALCKRGVGTGCGQGPQELLRQQSGGQVFTSPAVRESRPTQVAQRLRRFEEGPPGSERIPSTPPSEVEDRLIFEPVPDRWRIGYKRNIIDPYNQNILKGDYPIPGTQNLFLSSLA